MGENATKMADRVILVKLGDLEPYVNNARVHSEEQVGQIVDSILEFGFTNPILVDKASGIIAGHGRYEAAKRLGFNTVPVIKLDHLTDAQKRAYILADNKIAENSSWDVGTLRAELAELRLEEFDLGSIGFSDRELANLLADDEAVVKNPEGEWRGMPEHSHEDKLAYRSVLINFAKQEDVDAFAELIEQTITPRTKSVWFPKAEIETMMDKRYAADPEADIFE